MYERLIPTDGLAYGLGSWAISTGSLQHGMLLM